MKKVIYIHQYFKTPKEGGAIRSYHIAKGMVKYGYQVDLITRHNKSYKDIKNIDGINVHYLPIKYSNELPFSKRLISFIIFVFSAISECRRIKNVDLVYATSTPLTVGIVALWIKWRKKIPYIFEVRDLWPEAPIQLKIIKSSLLKGIAKKLEKVFYKNAEFIIALSPGIKKGIEESYPGAKIHMIPNMADTTFFEDKPPKTHDSQLFTIGYFGAFGHANNLDFILDVADACQKSKLDVVFKMAGEGAKRKSVLLAAEERQLKNILFINHMSRDRVRSTLNSVDAIITSFLNVPILETNSPNKFFDGMAAGKLSIVNTKGWLKELVEENKCGFYINPEKPEDFPDLIKPYLHDQKLLFSHQENAVKLAREQFQMDDLVKKICALVENLDLESIRNWLIF